MIKTSRLRGNRICSLVMIGLFCVITQAQDPLDAWKNIDFSKTALKQAQVQALAIEDLKLLRGIVFGRHGRIFKDAEIKAYLESQSWYKANTEFSNSMLNDT